MPRTVLPPRLERGDTIGIVTPSVPAPAGAPRRFERGIDQVERLGFEVRVAT
ncbi:MAG: hypothetical protein QOE95_978, partial [Gaiellaceae bacterium]|nr:hypothetical protein [Gaiellaceae bacterium]